MKEEKEFITESKQLLNLMINSIYSNTEIFLRELVSNASDAIDKYKFLGLTDSEKYKKCDHEIRIESDKKNRIITITDNGIGMSKPEIEKNLGTIAKSGSKEFLKKYKDAKGGLNTNIIGQFGVGFYSSFMVAKKVEVISKTVSSKPYLFSSTGVDKYSIEDTTVDENFEHGTQIKIYLKDDSEDNNYSKYLSEFEIKDLIKKYSDFIRYPIKMLVTKNVNDLDENNKPIEGKVHEEQEEEILNSMIPLWKKSKKEIKESDMDNFYIGRFEDYEKPFLAFPIKVEGNLTYDSLLYIPSHAPKNLYSENYQKGLALYSKGIFIQEKCPELLPDYLKFVKGLIDCADLPLNISREMLQSSTIIRRISSNIEIRIIDKLKETLKNKKKEYATFFKNFGEYIKFGIYNSFGDKKELLQDLLVYRTLLQDGYISLQEYADNAKKDQKFIYYACGKTVDEIKLLPQIEKYNKEKIDVLLLTENIDEFTLLIVKEFAGLTFKNIATDEITELSEEEKTKINELNEKHKDMLAHLKEALKDKVDDVLFSTKLVDSPVCISTKGGLSLSMEHILDSQLSAKKEDPASKLKAKKVLEVNAEHDLFKALADLNEDDIKYYASILYDEALLLEGYDIDDKREFITKLNKLVVNANQRFK